MCEFNFLSHKRNLHQNEMWKQGDVDCICEFKFLSHKRNLHRYGMWKQGDVDCLNEFNFLKPQEPCTKMECGSRV